MAKYDSFHFSPCNDRTILMPRHDKRIPLERPARPMRMGKRAFTQDGAHELFADIFSFEAGA